MSNGQWVLSFIAAASAFCVDVDEPFDSAGGALKDVTIAAPQATDCGSCALVFSLNGAVPNVELESVILPFAHGVCERFGQLCEPTSGCFPEFAACRVVNPPGSGQTFYTTPPRQSFPPGTRTGWFGNDLAAGEMPCGSIEAYWVSGLSYSQGGQNHAFHISMACWSCSDTFEPAESPK